MLVQDLCAAMESIAPLRLSEGWDNTGLLLGSSSRPLSGGVVLTIDLTEAVVQEATSMKAGAVVAYHPPLFDPIRRLTDETGRERVLLRAVEAGLAVYSPHTALDAVNGGVNDWLADGVLDRTGLVKADRRALRPAACRGRTEEVKIVTFLPVKDLEKVRDAMATAGAGLIGEYEDCSFSLEGTGSFRGRPGTNPAVGKPGALETVREARLEMVCSRHALPLAIETLKSFHPYEEPAVDVYELVGRPDRSQGAGRRLVLDQPATLAKIAERLKTHLPARGVWVATAAGHETKALSTIGVCAGSGGSLVGDALANGCEAFVTGEMKHHDVLAAVEAGLSVVIAGHTTTERGYLTHLATALRERLPGVAVHVSRADTTLLELN